TPAPFTTAAGPRKSSGASPKTPAAAVATIGDELRVLATLRLVGADLGDPIEILRKDGAIVVSGIGVAPQRQRQIQDALRLQPNVVIRFSDPASEKIEPEGGAPALHGINPHVEELQARIAEQLGSRALFSQLAAQTLDLSEPMMARVYALRRLAELVPREVEPELAPGDWQAIRNLQREHTDALRRQTAELDRLLRPAL